jgi:hypothetical protein
MRVIFGQRPFYNCAKRNRGARPASYARRRIEWVQPQFGSGARCDPPMHDHGPRLRSLMLNR